MNSIQTVITLMMSRVANDKLSSELYRVIGTMQHQIYSSCVRWLFQRLTLTLTAVCHLSVLLLAEIEYYYNFQQQIWGYINVSKYSFPSTELISENVQKLTGFELI